MALPLAKGAIQRRLGGNKKPKAPPKEKQTPLYDPGKLFGLVGEPIQPQRTLFPPMPNETLKPLPNQKPDNVRIPPMPGENIKPLSAGITPLGSPVGASVTQPVVNKEGRLSVPPKNPMPSYQAPGAGLQAPGNPGINIRNPNLNPIDPGMQTAISRDPVWAQQSAYFNAIKNQGYNQNMLAAKQLGSQYDITYEDMIEAAKRALQANQESAAARGVIFGSPYADVNSKIYNSYQTEANRTSLERSQKQQDIMNEWNNFLMSLNIQRQQAVNDAMARYQANQLNLV